MYHHSVYDSHTSSVAQVHAPPEAVYLVINPAVLERAATATRQTVHRAQKGKETHTSLLLSPLQAGWTFSSTGALYFDYNGAPAPCTAASVFNFFGGGVASGIMSATLQADGPRCGTIVVRTCYVNPDEGGGVSVSLCNTNGCDILDQSIVSSSAISINFEFNPGDVLKIEELGWGVLEVVSLTFGVDCSTSPTQSPTASPTTSPTTNPTQSPTASPTTSPTASPTTSPTLSPTASPVTPKKAKSKAKSVKADKPTTPPKAEKKGKKSAMAALTSSTATTTLVALSAATVVLVAAGVILSKKRQAAVARARVHPFNAETDANAKPTVDYAPPPTYDGCTSGDDRWAKVLDV